jgi:hypothetical protein
LIGDTRGVFWCECGALNDRRTGPTDVSIV